MSTPKNLNRRTKLRIHISPGSTPRAIDALEDVLAARTNGEATPHVLRLHFDANEAIPADLAPPTVVHRPRGSQFFIPALKLTNKASLEQAEKDGLITIPADGWHDLLRQAGDDDGAGGSPREGRERASIHGQKLYDHVYRLIQQVIAYEKRFQEIGKGNKLGIGRIPIHICASAVGGMGSGSLLWFLTQCVARCARDNGVEAKVVVELLCLGNLQTHDTHLARLNQLTGLKTLRAYSTGTFVDAATNSIMPIPFEQVRLYANINNRGSITSLKRLASHGAHLNHFSRNTPAGSDSEEREPDIASWGYGRFEDPMCGFTASTGAIHLKRSRLLDCCQYETSAMLAQGLLIEGDSGQVLKEATSLAHSCSLVESEEQSQLTALVSRPDELGGESVYARAEQSLVDRTSRARGHRGLLLLSETIQSIRDNDILSVFAPPMSTKAQAIVETAGEALGKHLARTLRKPQGLWEAIKFLQFLQMILERSQRAITEKANEMQEYLLPHEEVLADAVEQLQELVQQNWFRKSISFQQRRAISRILDESGRAAISCQLQIVACNIAIQNVLLPLADLIERKLARLVSTRQRLLELAQHCRNMAAAKANEPDVFDVPVGVELATPVYIDAWFGRYVARSGGSENLAAALRGEFLQQYESFACLTEMSMQEIEEALGRLCRAEFESAVAHLSVLTEFRQVYPDEQTQQQIMAELIGQTEGRLLMEAEVNKTIHFVKTANVPSVEDVEWAGKMLAHADPKPGKWQVAVNPVDPDTFSIAQMRGQISLTPFIKRLELPDTFETWKRLVATAADPVAAIGVGPNPTKRQFRRVLTKAIVAGLLTVEEKGCYSFRSSANEEWLLGKDTAAVHEKLQPCYRQLVFMESYFASQLVDHEKQIVGQLEQMKAQLQGKDQPADPLLRLTKVEAIDECLQQIQLLRPWAAQMRNVRKKVAL